MNSGRSAGRQRTSISLRTWVMRPPCSLIAGDFSALTKCRGTLMWIFSSAETRWKRSEEHTSELQSHSDLVCRLLLEKKKNKNHQELYVQKHRHDERIL